MSWIKRFFLFGNNFCCIFKTSESCTISNKKEICGFQKNSCPSRISFVLCRLLLISWKKLFFFLLISFFFFSRFLMLLIPDQLRKQRQFLLNHSWWKNSAPQVESKFIRPLFFFYWKHFDLSKKGIFFSWTLTLEVKVLFWIPLNRNGLFLFKFQRRIMCTKLSKKSNRICAFLL